MALSLELFRLIFLYLDSFTLYRLQCLSRWFRDAIATSDGVWKRLLTSRFPMLSVNAPARKDYYAMQRSVDQHRLELTRFGGIPSIQEYAHHPNSVLRLPAGYKSIRSIACGGFFFAIHTVTNQLLVVTDRHRQDIFGHVAEFRCGRSTLLYRSGRDWFLRRNIQAYSARSDDVPLPDRIKLVECGWETAVALTDSNDLHIMSREQHIWHVPIQVDLMGCGENGVVIVNETGLYQSSYEQQSWDLLYAFQANQKAQRLKVWFQSIALQTSRGWLVKHPKSDRLVELPDDVRDVHLGDWHYLYIMADGSVWSGGDHCRGANLSTEDKAEPGPVPERCFQHGPVFQYSCGGWQTLVLYLGSM